VAFTPGEAFFVDGTGERTLRLSFSSVPASRIDDGVRRLADAIRVALRRPVGRRAVGVPVPVV
jgi:DNA-binding transcriptional MocR family regulator